jgi:hypothetical protein
MNNDNANPGADPMDFPDGSGPRDPMPEHIMSSGVGVSEGIANDRGYTDDVAPAPLAYAPDRVAADVISLDSMRDNLRGSMVANFEHDDLDVPAFLRKRSEVM